MFTGWFGRPTQHGLRAKSTKYVHLYNQETNTCLCGYKPHPTMEFQFNAYYVHLPYVDCSKCKTTYIKEAERKFDKTIQQFGIANKL